MTTTITLGLTAMAPGQDSSHAWDYWWRDLSSWNGDFVPAGVSDWTSISWSYTAMQGRPAAGDMMLNISLDAAWNTVKDIEVTQLDCYELNVNNFVDTCVAAVGDDMSHEITVIGAKRGAIDLGNGNNQVNLQYLSNEYTWSNNFTIAAGNGNDTINVMPEATYLIPRATLATGWAFNSAPDQTTVDIALGSGTILCYWRSAPARLPPAVGRATSS